ncbi:MAG: acyl-CoA thioester hydrolase/BAAT C-terminal domain-containing protein [Gemmatimonas sp.]
MSHLTTAVQHNFRPFVFAARRLLSVSALSWAALTIAACSDAARPPRMVDVQTADGVILKASVFATGKPGPGVLMLHQCDDQRTVWDSLGARLQRAGITAMSFDYRGYGASGGIPHDKLSPAELSRVQTEHWPTDIDSAYAVLLRQPGVEPEQIGIAGGSCGVQNGMLLANRLHNVKALALLAGSMDARGRSFIAQDSAPPLFLGAAADDQYADFVEIQSWYGGLSRNAATRVISYPDGGHAALVFRKHPAFADTIAQWFDAVLHNKPTRLPKTSGAVMSAEVMATLAELDQSGGPDRVALRLADARKSDPAAQLFPEYFANQLGYEHVVIKDFAGAIAIMKLNTVAYPASPNAFDSLGDVYLAAGDTTNAIASARRALQLLETDSLSSKERKETIRASAEAKLTALGSR